MKKTTKLLSVILALVMMFSTVSVAFAGTLKTETYNSVEALLEQNKNGQNVALPAIVSSLLKDIAGAKENITGTILKFVLMFVDDIYEGDKAELFNKSDEQLATILLDWVNNNLPTWFDFVKDVEEYSGAIKAVIGVDVSKITTVDGLLEQLYNAGNSGLIHAFGDLDGLTANALTVDKRAIKRSDGNIKVIYALFNWLVEISPLLEKFVKGGVGENGLNVGGLVNTLSKWIPALGGALDNVNVYVKNIPDFAKGYIYLLVDGYADKPDIKADPKGGWGKDKDYSSFTADELLAVALIKLIRNDKKVVDNGGTPAPVTKAEADAALSKSFYDLLAENLEALFNNYNAAEWLNENVGKLAKDLSVTPEITKVFKSTITFTNDTLKPVYASAKTNGVLGAVNDLLVVIAKTVLTDASYKTLALTAGANTNLNANLKKICQFILPLMANKTVSDNLGYDFTKFTASAVKTMELKDMAVAILKLFFEDWFDNAVKADVNKAETLEQLGALAVYYTATNDWLPFDVTVSAPKAGLKADAATEYILDTGALIGLNALKYNGDKIYFSSDVTSGYKNIVDDISDWGLNFVKGIPAVIAQEQKDGRMTNKRGTFDDVMNGGAFYKVNVVLNELIDFSFFTNDKADYNNAPTTFKFDLGLFLTNTLLDNIYNFDVAGLLGAFKKNNSSLLGKPVINAVLSIADRAVTALFKHSDVKSSSGVSAIKDTCTDKTTFSCTSYDTFSGHYLAKATNKTETKKTPSHKWTSDTTHKTGATCKEKGYITKTCTICGKVEKTDGSYGAHKFTVKVKTVAPTCAAQGYDVYKCAVCGKEDAAKHNVVNATGKHNYKDGVCTVCKAKDPNYKPTPVGPTYKLGDIDDNGVIEAADARLALRGSVGIKGDTDAKGVAINFADTASRAFLAANVDFIDGITAADARLILRASVKLEDPATWVKK